LQSTTPQIAKYAVTFLPFCTLNQIGSFLGKSKK
jgi:hypothetical protein